MNAGNKSLRKEASMGNYFSIGVLISVAVYWLIMLVTRSANIDAYFVTDHTNTAMDYFNMLSMAGMPDPWIQNANYPAMCFLILKLLGYLIPEAEIADAFALRNNMSAQFGYFIFMLACLIIIWETARHMAKGTNCEKILFCCALIFSGPMLFLLERGNILIAALAFSMLYLLLYDSDKLSYRIVGYFCLSIAAAIKIYPAVLGLLTLSKKRYKEAVMLVVIGGVCFLAPFFAFDGFASLREMLIGISCANGAQSSIGLGINFCMNNLLQIIGAFFGNKIASVPGWVSLASACFCLCLFAVSTQEWQKLYALVLLCIWFPGFSYTYTLVLLFLPIISFLYRSDRKQGWLRSAYAIGFALTIIPYAFPMAERVNDVFSDEYIKFPLSWGVVLINLVLVLLAVMISVDAAADRLRRKKDK